MKKHITFSNIVFVIVLVLVFYKPSRSWVIRQFSFSPSVIEVQNSEKIKNYNWQLKGLNTSTINFEELKGKVIFVNFWATWCPPCIAEMPSVQRFYDAYKDKVAFVFITNDEWKLINEFYKENHYNLPVYQSLINYPKGLPSTSSIPRTFVIDKSGFIRFDKSGSADWDSSSFRAQIDSFLNE